MTKKVEEKIQKELVKWIHLTYPLVDIRLNKLDGLKNIIEIVKDKAMGQAKAGTPDITLIFSHNNYTFIFDLELKKKDGVLNSNQKKWFSEFKPTFNHHADVAYGFAMAQSLINTWIQKCLKK